MANLLALPHEILHSILRGVDPQDLHPLSLSCRTLYAFLKDNHTLYKDIYLQNLVSFLLIHDQLCLGLTVW